MSQEQSILEYLKKGNSITPLEALNFFGSFRLADIIFKLRKRGLKDGYSIKTDLIPHGKGHFARYTLLPFREVEPNGQLNYA